MSSRTHGPGLRRRGDDAIRLPSVPLHPSTITLLDPSMSYAKRFHSTARPSIPSVSPKPTARRPTGSRHELHAALDGELALAEPDHVETRGTLAAGLAAVAMLPLVGLLLERLAEASRGLVAVTASLPLIALLLVAVTWRPARGGRP